MDDFEGFCAAVHPKLVAALAHHFGDRFLAEDLAQEALVRAGARWTKVSRMASPVGWAYRVGCNHGTSIMRRRAAERRALARRRDVAMPHHDPDTPDRLAVQEALAQLSPRQRQAVIATYYLDLTSEQAAEALGMAASTVRVQAARGLARMRELLAPAPDEEGAHAD